MNLRKTAGWEIIKNIFWLALWHPQRRIGILVNWFGIRYADFDVQDAKDFEAAFKAGKYDLMRAILYAKGGFSTT